MSSLPLINALIKSINDSTNDLPQNKPLTMVVLEIPQPTAANPSNTKQRTIHVLGKLQEVKDKVNLWLNGNADLVGYESRYTNNQITFTHREALGASAVAL